MSFLAELKRRKVYRVAVVYAVVGLGVLEAAEMMVPRLQLPDSISTVVLLLLILGFPVALVLAWAFEITPEGVKREDPEAGTESGGLGQLVGTIVLLVAVFGLGWWVRPSGIRSAGERISIAILPLESISADPEDQAFTDGMHEEIYTQLQKIGGLRVISRTSVMGYRDNPRPVPVMAEELGASALVEGSLRRGGDEVRITVRLIDPITDEETWSDSYTTELSDSNDLFVIQAEIARGIARALRVALSGDDEAGLGRIPSVDLGAYELYLLGRHHLNRRSPDEIIRGEQYLQRSLDLDSTFAPAHAALAEAYRLLPNFAGLGELAPMHQLAKASAEKAVELDSLSAEGRRALGLMMLAADFDAVAAEEQVRWALALNPNDAFAYVVLSQTLLSRNRASEAITALETALELDPLSTATAWTAGLLYGISGDLRRAETAIRRVLEIEPSFEGPHLFLLRLSLSRGDLTEAMGHAQALADAGAVGPAWQEIIPLVESDPFGASDLLHGYYVQNPPEPGQTLSPGEYFALLGDAPRATEWTRRAWELNDYNVLVRPLGPFFDAVRDDAGFIALLREIERNSRGVVLVDR